MPRIRYLCECGKEFHYVYQDSKSIQKTMDCPSCAKLAKRQLSAASTTSKFMVDNGLMARAVEIDMAVIESNKERSKKGYNRGD